jgi:hypothetical protein
MELSYYLFGVLMGGCIVVLVLMFKNDDMFKGGDGHA